MAQIHKRFTDSRVKELLQRYDEQDRQRVPEGFHITAYRSGSMTRPRETRSTSASTPWGLQCPNSGSSAMTGSSMSGNSRTPISMVCTFKS